MQIFIIFKYSSSISVPANGNINPDITLGTLTANFQPRHSLNVIGSGNANTPAIQITTERAIIAAAFNATGSAYTIAANSDIVCSATFTI